ncbi:MAG: hypothetical protein KME46_32695 [Brasilonema angustatum HA4187-MV1]|jgi:hypothetical protein|nr:hypothetical protein [Brasilonema angustatum HA4187-MV1]
MQSKEEKEFARMKPEALAEAPKKQFTFENYKYIMAGSFWGLMTGIVMGHTLPQEKIANNKWINKYFKTAAEYPPSIFQQSIYSMFTMLGTLVGGITQLVKDKDKTAEPHAAEARTQAALLSEPEFVDNSNNITPNTKMQDGVMSRRQEATNKNKER